jgi:hypothetical protein
MSSYANILKSAKEPPKYVLRYRFGFNALPNPVSIGGMSWHRTEAASATGTYAYCQVDNMLGYIDTETVATNSHYTVTGSSVTGAITGVHYTEAGTGYRIFYAHATQTYHLAPTTPQTARGRLHGILSPMVVYLFATVQVAILPKVIPKSPSKDDDFPPLGGGGGGKIAV